MGLLTTSDSVTHPYRFQLASVAFDTLIKLASAVIPQPNKCAWSLYMLRKYCLNVFPDFKSSLDQLVAYNPRSSLIVDARGTFHARKTRVLIFLIVLSTKYHYSWLHVFLYRGWILESFAVTSIINVSIVFMTYMMAWSIVSIQSQVDSFAKIRTQLTCPSSLILMV